MNPSDNNNNKPSEYTPVTGRKGSRGNQRGKPRTHYFQRRDAAASRLPPIRPTVSVLSGSDFTDSVSVLTSNSFELLNSDESEETTIVMEKYDEDYPRLQKESDDIILSKVIKTIPDYFTSVMNQVTKTTRPPIKKFVRGMEAMCTSVHDIDVLRRTMHDYAQSQLRVELRMEEARLTSVFPELEGVLPKKVSGQTPDVIFFHRPSKKLLLMDIAVSISPRADIRKVSKYNALVMVLNSLGLMNEGQPVETEFIPLIVFLNDPTSNSIRYEFFEDPEDARAKFQYYSEFWRFLSSIVHMSELIQKHLSQSDTTVPLPPVDPINRDSMNKIFKDSQSEDIMRFLESDDYDKLTKLDMQYLDEFTQEILVTASHPVEVKRECGINWDLFKEYRKKYLERCSNLSLTPVEDKNPIKFPYLSVSNPMKGNLMERFKIFKSMIKGKETNSVGNWLTTSIRLFDDDAGYSPLGVMSHTTDIDGKSYRYDVVDAKETKDLTPEEKLLLEKSKKERASEVDKKNREILKKLRKNINDPSIKEYESVLTHHLPYVPIDPGLRTRYELDMLIKLKSHKQKVAATNGWDPYTAKLNDPKFQYSLDPNLDVSYIDDYLADSSIMDHEPVIIVKPEAWSSSHVVSQAKAMKDIFQGSDLGKMLRRIREVTSEISSNSGRSMSELGFYFTVTESGIGVLVDPRGQIRQDSGSIIHLMYPVKKGEVESYSQLFKPGRKISNIQHPLYDYYLSKPFVIQQPDLMVFERIDDTMCVSFADICVKYTANAKSLAEAYEDAFKFSAISAIIRLSNSNRLALLFQNTRYYAMRVISELENPGTFAKDKLTDQIRSGMELWLLRRMEQFFLKQEPITIPYTVMTNIKTMEDFIKSTGGKQPCSSLLLDRPQSLNILFNEIYVCNAISPDVGDKTQGDVKAIKKTITSELKNLTKPSTKEHRKDCLNGFVNLGPRETAKMSSVRERHQFSAHIVTASMKLLYQNRKPLIDDGVKKGLRRAFQNLSEMATLKSMVICPPDSFSMSADQILSKCTFDDIWSACKDVKQGVKIHDMMAENFKSKGLSSGIWTSNHNKEIRTKVAAMVLSYVNDNPEKMTPVHVLCRTVNDQVLPLIDIFKKNQIGGVREIFIMSFSTRFSIFVLEKVFEAINEGMKEEYLTSGESKAGDMVRMINDVLAVCSEMKGTSVMETADQSEWGPNFVTNIFSCLLKPINHLLGNLYPYMISMMAMMTNKNIEITKNMTEQWIKNSELKTGNEEMNFLKEACLEQNNFMINVQTGMGQGIVHNGSSLLHVALAQLVYHCFNAICDHYGMDYSLKLMLSSDDRASVFGIWNSVAQDATDDEKRMYVRRRSKFINYPEGMSIDDCLSYIPLISVSHLFKHVLTRCSALFCIIINNNKTIHHPFVIEFNSRFCVFTHGTEPSIKQAYRSCAIPMSSSFKGWVEQLYSDVRSYSESDGQGSVCHLIHLLNKEFCEEFFATGKGMLNDVSVELGMDQSDLPYAFGCYPLLPPAFSEVCGPKLHDFMVSERSKQARSLLEKMCSFRGLIIQGDNDYSGAYNYPFIRTMTPRSLNSLRSLVFSQVSSLDDMMDKLKSPLSVLYPPSTQEEAILKIGTMLYSQGAKLSYTHINMAVHLSRMRAMIFTRRNYLPSKDEPMFWKESILNIYHSEGNSNYLDMFYFSFSNVYRNIMNMENIRRVDLEPLNQNIPKRKVKVTLGYSKNLLPVKVNVAIGNWFGLEYAEQYDVSQTDLDRSSSIIRSLLPTLSHNLEECSKTLGIHKVMVIKALANYLSQKEKMKIIKNTRLYNESGNAYYILMADQLNGYEKVKMDPREFHKYTPAGRSVQFISAVRSTLAYHSFEGKNFSYVYSQLLSAMTHSHIPIKVHLYKLLSSLPDTLPHLDVTTVMTMMIALRCSQKEILDFMVHYPSPVFKQTIDDTIYAIKRSGANTYSLSMSKTTRKLLPIVYGDIPKDIFVELFYSLKKEGFDGIETDLKKMPRIKKSHHFKFSYEDDKLHFYRNIDAQGSIIYREEMKTFETKSYFGLKLVWVDEETEKFIHIVNESNEILHRIPLTIPFTKDPTHIGYSRYDIDIDSPWKLAFTDVYWNDVALCPTRGIENLHEFFATSPSYQTSVVIPNTYPPELFQILKAIVGQGLMRLSESQYMESVDLQNNIPIKTMTTKNVTNNIIYDPNEALYISMDTISEIANSLNIDMTTEVDVIDDQSPDSQLEENRKTILELSKELMKISHSQIKTIHSVFWSDHVLARMLDLVGKKHWDPSQGVRYDDLVSVVLLLSKFHKFTVTEDLQSFMEFRREKIQNGICYLLSMVITRSADHELIPTDYFKVVRNPSKKMNESLVALTKMKDIMPFTKQELAETAADNFEVLSVQSMKDLFIEYISVNWLYIDEVLRSPIRSYARHESDDSILAIIRNYEEKTFKTSSDEDDSSTIDQTLSYLNVSNFFDNDFEPEDEDAQAANNLLRQIILSGNDKPTFTLRKREGVTYNSKDEVSDDEDLRL